MSAAPDGPGARRFPRSARLLSGKEFDRVFRQGRATSVGVFRVHYLASEHGARLGLAIARKSLPRAVDRNRLKRQLRERFRQHRAQLPDVDLVIRVQPMIRTLDPAQRQDQLDALWQRVAALTPPLPRTAHTKPQRPAPAADTEPAASIAEATPSQPGNARSDNGSITP